MYDSAYVEAMRDKVKCWIKDNEKNRYRNIQVKKGLFCFQKCDYYQNYESHYLNPFYDTTDIFNILLWNRIEILLRGQE